MLMQLRGWIVLMVGAFFIRCVGLSRVGLAC